MLVQNTPIAIACFASTFIFASLVEYWLHRLMHVSKKVGECHLDRHRRNEGRGVLWEFRDYVRGGILAMFVMFLFS